MKAVPVDVMRAMRNHIASAKNRVIGFRRDAAQLAAAADAIDSERFELESMVEAWKRMFPETEE